MGFFLRLFFGGALVSVLGVFLINTLESLDITKVVHSHAPGPCQFVTGIEYGAEDIAVLSSGMAIMSTGLQFTKAAKNQPAMKYLDMSNTKDVEAKTLKLIGFNGKLNPHGISLYEKSGILGTSVYVYSVNHPPYCESPPADTVEKFLWDVKAGTLTHQKSFSDPTFLGLNDLVVVDEDKFYITNMIVSQNALLKQIEMLALSSLPLQNVVYFDGKKGVVVLDACYGPNGINISPDKKFLYLAEVHKRRISSFEIKAPLNLTLVDQRFLGTVPDNIDVNLQTGDLWIGTHPVGHQVMKRLLTGQGQSSSLVLRVGVKDGKFTTAKEPFADNGSKLTASSVAVHSKGNLIIGTIDHKALICKCLTC